MFLSRRNIFITLAIIMAVIIYMKAPCFAGEPCSVPPPAVKVEPASDSKKRLSVIETLEGEASAGVSAVKHFVADRESQIKGIFSNF